LHGLGAGGDVLEAFFEEALGVDGGRGRAVAGDIGSLGGNFLDHLCAHVLVGVFEFDFLRHGHAVFGDGGRAEGLLEHDDPAGGAEGDLDGPGQRLHAAANAFSRLGIECNLLLRHCWMLLGFAVGLVDGSPTLRSVSR